MKPRSLIVRIWFSQTNSFRGQLIDPLEQNKHLFKDEAELIALIKEVASPQAKSIIDNKSKET